MNAKPEPRSSVDRRTLRGVLRDLASPRSGLRGQLVRFGLAGGFVTLLYIAITTVLAQVVGLPFELALGIGFVSALLAHFTFQRLFVWVNDEGFALSFRRQVARYLTMAGTQYACTVASTAILPGVLGVPTEIVYLFTMAAVTTAGFLVMRFIIFHAGSVALDSDDTSQFGLD